MKLKIYADKTELENLKVACSICQELEHLYDGVNDTKCKIFGDATRELIDIINYADESITIL